MRNTRTLLRYPAVLLSLCFFRVFLSADVYGQDSRGKHHFLMYLTAPTMTFLNEDKTSELEIGDVAWTMEIGVQSKLNGWIGISGALGYGGIKDYNSFSQGTTWGTLESSFTTLSYDFKAGVWSPHFSLTKTKNDEGLNFTAGVSSGYEGFSGRREIVNCENCDVEKFSFRGGIFVEPELSFFFLRNLLGVATSYRYFVGNGDLNSSWTLLKVMVRFDLLNQ